MGNKGLLELTQNVVNDNENKVYLTLTKGFACGRCIKTIKGIAVLHKKIPFHDQVVFVNSWLFERNRSNASDGMQRRQQEQQLNG